MLIPLAILVDVPHPWRWRLRRSWWEAARCPCRCLWGRGGWQDEELSGRPDNQHHHVMQSITASAQQLQQPQHSAAASSITAIARQHYDVQQLFVDDEIFD